MGVDVDRFDYVIVGAGSAGCVLANRLSANPRNSVLLIESGPADTHPFIRMPRGVAKLHTPGNPHVKYYQVSKGGNRPEETWYKGSTIGGSSTINGMVYVRGAPLDYDGWESAGCKGWGWEEMGQCFVELEDHELGASSEAVRGSGGPLKISVHPTRNKLTEAILDAGVACGVPRAEDVNDVRVVRDGGMGYLSQTTYKGERFSAARAFLDPIKSRPNLTIVTETSVRKILFDDNKVVGVAVRNPSGDRTHGIDGELILSAGALESPKLLQLSGIGPRPLLESLGINVIKDSPWVGRNLREHRFMAMMYRVTTGSYNKEFRGLGLMKSLLKYALFRKGPLTHTAHEIVGFIKSTPELEHADVQLGIGLYSMVRGPKGYEIDSKPGLTLGGYFTRPESQGELRITSSDPDAPPFINANYLDAEIDRTSGINMIRWIRKLAAQEPLKSLIVEELSPGPSFQTNEQLFDALVERAGTAFHVSGTCRMGADEESVVDCELRVRGVEGLRVCDTSIFPTLVSGNTNAPAMATALRLSKLMA